MPEKQLKTNEDLVVDLMTYSPRGALCQAFIIEAISRYCKEVIAAPDDKVESGFISAAAWKEIAADIKGRMDAFYAR